jgi:hypothetical protein
MTGTILSLRKIITRWWLEDFAAICGTNGAD